MKVTDEVYALESTRGNYAYAVLGSEVTLVDTGHPGQGQKILDELSQFGIQPNAIRNVFLTHHDVDHIGSAAFLQRTTGATLWASAIDIPYILKKKPRPGIKRFVSRLMSAEVPPTINEFPLDNVLGEWQIIPTPGHTPGHVCLLYQDVLFAGDLVMGIGGKLRPSLPLMTWDQTQVQESVKKVGKFSFEWICPAHGGPIRRGSLWEQL